MSAGTVDFTAAASPAKMTFHPHFEISPVQMRKMVVDLADIAAVKGSAAAASDTIDVMDIPAGTLVLGVATRMLVPVAGGSVSSPTITIGDQSAMSFADTAIAVDAAAQTFAAGSGAYLQKATSPYNVYGGKFYATTDALQVTLGGTWTGATAGRFEVYMMVCELGTGLLN